MNVTEQRQELFKAIAAAQGEFKTVEKSATNPHFKSKFAPLDNIIEMIRPILPKHGLSVMQFTDIPETGEGIIIETVITHDSGQYISGRLRMPVAKNDPQGYGASISYGRRYALGAALGIVSDEDIDGNQPEQKPSRQQQQRQQSTPPPKAKVSEAQTKLYQELGEACSGNVEQMADLLHTISSFMSKDQEGNQVERYLKIADLEKPNDNEKFQRWIGSALGNLRKEVGTVNAAFDEEKNRRIDELRKDMPR